MSYRKQTSGYRSIEIDGRSWEYKVGQSYVHLRDPDGKGHTAQTYDIGEEVSDGDYYSNVSVKPSHIKAWAERILASTKTPEKKIKSRKNYDLQPMTEDPI